MHVKFIGFDVHGPVYYASPFKLAKNWYFSERPFMEIRKKRL